MTKIKSQRSIDLCVIIGLVLISILITILGRISFLISTLLFFGLPSIYLISRRPKNIKKATFAGIIFGLVFGFSFDFIAEFNHAWGWASNFTLPATIFGIVSLDVLVWFFFWVFLIIAYYEYFIEHDRSTKISPRAKWAFLVGVIIAVITVFIWKIYPVILVMKYAYAELGIIIFIVSALLLIKNYRLFHKVLRVVPFFVFMYLSYEITALYMKLWTFPGAYLGSVTLGATGFPLEELLVWIIASSAIIVTYYEFCIDDNK